MLTLVWRSWKWKREKGLALLAVVALAIGIGSATAIFTVVDAVLLRPLPYTHGERWVALFGGSTFDSRHFSVLALLIFSPIRKGRIASTSSAGIRLAVISI